MPLPWGLTLQAPGTVIGDRIQSFHDLLLAIIFAVVLLVLALLVYVVIRYNRTRNPVPSRRTHNLKLEVIWTLIPCLIVLGIAWISFPLLYDMDRMPLPDLTLKVTGHQWYWSYEYPERAGVAFDSMAIWDAFGPSEEQTSAAIKDASAHWLIKSQPMRLLEVDHRVVLPVGKVVRVQITGGDVLHSWYVSSLSINRMAVVGRLNEIWLKIERPGVYYGECSMICGNGHGFMPIVIEGVPADQFESWAAAQKAANNQENAHPAAS
ncbi:MAG TPA: cytochrome c oxidase subunit II [Candidatus Sulfotelmatobacter sp.]|nr:cytochrome c oxidase subunit II [Candidatus Sulfotelmatobacter sp.]